MTMRVVQLGPYPPPHGGVQNNLVAIRRSLLYRGIRCTVINLTRHRKTDADDIYYPKSWIRVLWLLLTLRCNIIHLHIGGNLTRRLLGLSLACCLVPGTKAVLTFHSGGYPSSEEGRNAHPRTLRGFIFRRFDRVIGVNPDIVQLFHKFGLRSERLRLIYPHSIPDQAPGVSLPEQLQRFLDSHKPILLTVGLLEPEYDLPLQIEVLGALRRKHPKAGLIITGSGSLEETLKKLIHSTPHSDDILLCGDVPHSATLRVISESDVFLRTTLYDGDSIAVREALHLGTPVIATDTGMRPDGVHLIPFSNLDALSNAIEEHLKKPITHQHRPGNSEKNIEAVFELYRELIPE